MKTLNFKFLFLAAGLTLCAGAVRADYWLNWRVDDSSPTAFEYAKVAVNQGSGYTTYLMGRDLPNDEFPADSVPELGTSVGSGALAANGVTVIGTGTPENSYQFRVELFSGDDLLAYSDSASWSFLTEGSFAGTDITQGVGQEVWAPTVFHSVPEPTSGMLFLLGLASLALRRKRVEG